MVAIGGIIGFLTSIIVVKVAVILYARLVNDYGGKTAEDTTTTNDKQVSMAQSEEKVAPPDQNEIFKAVLLGDSPFFYCSDGKAETMVIQTQQE